MRCDLLTVIELSWIILSDVAFIFNSEKLERIRNEFSSAIPIPHAVIDDVVGCEQLDELVRLFPEPSWERWTNLGTEYEKNKFVCNLREMFPGPIRELIDDLQSPEFLRQLEIITGIGKLIPDPYLTGGGMHLSTEGGILAPHTDFHIYERLDLYRRINVLVYLNPDWKLGDGGSLRLWDSHRRNDVDEVSIDPLGGRMVIFRTDDRSVHGFTDPIRSGCRRRSIALYYYTSAESRRFSGDSTTHWREHVGRKKRQIPREILFRLFLQASRGFSLLAHLTNPRQGMTWWKVRSQRIKSDR